MAYQAENWMINGSRIRLNHEMSFLKGWIPRPSSHKSWIHEIYDKKNPFQCPYFAKFSLFRSQPPHCSAWKDFLCFGSVEWNLSKGQDYCIMTTRSTWEAQRTVSKISGHRDFWLSRWRKSTYIFLIPKTHLQWESTRSFY